MVAFETLRFPILFGTFLATFATGFIFRDKLIGDINEQREVLNLHKTKESDENLQYIRGAITK